MPAFVRRSQLTAHRHPGAVRWANVRMGLMDISGATHGHSCSVLQPTWSCPPYLPQKTTKPTERNAPSSLGRDKYCCQRKAEPLTQRGLSYSQLQTVESPFLIALLACLGHRLQGLGTFISQAKVKPHGLGQAQLRPAYLLRIPLFNSIPSPEFDAAVLRQFQNPQYLMNIADGERAHISQASHHNQTTKQQKAIYFYFSMCAHHALDRYARLQCRAAANTSPFHNPCSKWRKGFNKQTISMNSIHSSASIYYAEAKLFKSEDLNKLSGKETVLPLGHKRVPYVAHQLKHGETHQKRQI